MSLLFYSRNDIICVTLSSRPRCMKQDHLSLLTFPFRQWSTLLPSLFGATLEFFSSSLSPALFRRLIESVLLLGSLQLCSLLCLLICVAGLRFSDGFLGLPWPTVSLGLWSLGFFFLITGLCSLSTFGFSVSRVSVYLRRFFHSSWWPLVL